MKQYFALQPFAGFGKSGYRAKFVGRTDKQGRSFDAIAAAAAKGSLLDGAALNYAYCRVMNEAIGGALKTGEIQRFGPYGSLMLNLHGHFDGIDDTFDPERHSLDFRFVPGVALKGHTPEFAVENVIAPTKFVVHEIGPMGEVASVRRDGSRYMVRGLETMVNVSNGLMSAGDSVVWEAETAARTYRTGAFTVLENDASIMHLAWPADFPAALHKNELTLVFTLHGNRTDGAPQIRRVCVPLYDM